MKGEEKTEEQLKNELMELHKKITQLEQVKASQKQKEKKLAKSEELYRLIAENTADVITSHQFNLKATFTYISPSGKDIGGYEPEELLGKSPFNFIHPDDKKKLFPILKDYINAKVKKFFTGKELPATGRIEFRFKDKEGNWCYFQSTGNIVGNQLLFITRDITENKKMEEELRENQQISLTLMNNLPGMSYRCRNDRDWTMEFVSVGCLDLTGYKQEEIINNKVISFGQLIHKDDQNYVWDEVQAGLKSRKHYTLVYRIKTAEGREKWVWEQSQGVFTADGKLLHIEGFITDITERKLTEETLHKSQQEFASLFDNSPQALAYLDPKSNILNINPLFTELFGYTLEEVKGRNIDEGIIHPPDKMEEAKELTNKSLKGDFYRETVRKKKDGTLFPVAISGSQVIIDGQLKGLIGTFKDLTERKKTEEALQKSQQEFASLFKSSPDALVYMDEEANILDINSHFTELFGYALEDVKGRNIDDGMIHPPDKIEEGKRLSKNGFEGRLNHETVRKKKDGTLFPVHISSAPVIIKGEKKGFIAVYRDITERKKSEETLRKNQQELASIFKNIPQAVVYLDENSNIKNISPRFTELFGYTLEEIKGKNINEGMIHPPEKIEEGKNLDKTASSEGYFNYESIRKKKDGTLFPVSISGSNIIIDGQLKGMIGTYFDITERKKMEEELEKLAHYDVLTGCCSRGHGLALLEQQIKTANRKKTPILLLYLDVDKFKEINDTYGHKEGDRVLKEVVQLFKSTLRKVDIICRIGGDEFMLIFLESSLNNAPLIRERLSKNLEKLNQYLNKPYKISFSIGLSVYNPSNPLSIEELIKIADENMYKEKKKKKEGFFKTNVEEL